MADLYHKVATTFRTSFNYLDDAGAPVTGLTSGDFTIRVTKNNANLAVAGLTLSEVDSTNEPGEYGITVNGSTGFTSAVGTYDILIWRTSLPQHRWLQTVRVTIDGTGNGSYGTVSFTAVASNGRIMSGGVALAGATVRILDPVGNLFAQVTSGVTGLWGPVWFVDDGTYPVYAQKSGYTVSSGTIVISGSASAAAGPGADISITAASSSSGLTASLLWSHFKRAMRERSGPMADLLAQQGCDDALAMISQECEWPWYHTVYPVTLKPYYNTGTLALVEGDATVTLTGGTFPTYAASCELYVNGQWYAVATRTDGTHIELAQDWGEASVSGQSFVMAQSSYDLPEDLLSIDGIRYDLTWSLNGFTPRSVSMATLLMARATGQWSLNRPTLWAVQKDKLVVWPLPGEKRSFNLLYYRKPLPLANANDEADWDPCHRMVLWRGIEYQVALRGDCVVGTAEKCMEQYQLALTKAMQFDKAATDRDLSNVDTTAENQWWRGEITG